MARRTDYAEVRDPARTWRGKCVGRERDRIRGADAEGAARATMSLTCISRAVGFSGVAVFLAVTCTPVMSLMSRAMMVSPQLEPAEAVVVLAGGIGPDGVLTDSSMRRTLHGILLYREGLAPKLVLLGKVVAEGWNEAEGRAGLARRLGVPAEAVSAVAGTHTTREEALRVAEFLRPQGVGRILLVTDSTHMIRARALFERAGFQVLAAPVSQISSDARMPGKRFDLLREIAREFLARLYYRLVGYL